MKLKIYFLSLLLLAAVSCDKALDEGEQFGSSHPTDLDAEAGTWRMIVLPTAQQVAVAALGDTTTDVYKTAYRAEIATIKTAQSNLDANKRKIIQYWSAGGVIRWNQILRELVARYNLPPAPLADNTYPIPDSKNPFADPNFPFANPPYAARAYSYVAVAQYEAMKAAWYYKYLYNRPAPHKFSSAVKALVPMTDLPAYPSEDAVLSGVSAELLKNLFPAAVEEITRRAADQRNAALWSGKASTTDVSAGLALGEGIAAYIITNRAATDGMKNAVGGKAIWQAYEKSATDRNETSWKSLDVPVRPPMLMMFKAVKAWNMTQVQIDSLRPKFPPSTTSENMKKECEEVKYYATHLTRERLSIVHKWADGVGTYTPPGHWNDIATEYIADANLSEVRAARAYALLNMALHDAAVGCWDTKFFYFNPRPSQVDPSIKTATGVPNFPSYTSGHSTFSGAAATVLTYLFPSGGVFFAAQADEASKSRLYGGIHYRSDIDAGLEHGQAIGKMTIKRGTTDGGN
jgi:hypothetical protein